MSNSLFQLAQRALQERDLHLVRADEQGAGNAAAAAELGDTDAAAGEPAPTADAAAPAGPSPPASGGALTLVEPGELDEEGEAGISAEDRQEILAEINAIVDQSRIPVQPDTFEFTPQRSGARLPVLINVGAVALVVGAAVAFSAVFNRAEEGLVTGRTAVESAEGRLIEALREETDAALNEKDQEIANIQGRLGELNDERDQLLEDTELRVAAREAELRAQLDAELAAERQRLQQQGVASADIDAQLRELETSRQAQFNDQVAALRAETDAELAERQRTIDSLRNQFEDDLARAQQERAQVEESLAEREAELRAELQQQQASLDAERSEIDAELQRIQAQRDRERVVFDQILGLYRTVSTQLDSADYSSARLTLRTLADYLNQGPISALPSIQQRKPVELFLIESLEQLIDNEESATSTDTSSLVAAANILDSVSRTVERANTSFTAGNLTEAQTQYRRAIEAVPALGQALQRVESIGSQLQLTEQQAQLNQLVALGDTAFLAGDYPTALSNYSAALQALDGDDALLQRTVQRISQAGAQSAAAASPPQALSALAASDQQRENGQLQQALDSYLNALRSFPQGSHVARGLDGIRASVDALIDSYQSQIDSAESQVASLQSAGAESADQAEQNAAEAADAAQTLAAVSAARDELEAQLTATTEERDAAQAALEAAEQRLAALQGEQESAGAELDSASAELDATSTELAAAQRDAQTANAALEQARAELDAAMQSAAALEEQLAAAEERATALAEHVAAGQAEPGGEGGASSEELAAAQQQAEQLAAETATLREQAAAAELRAQEAEQQAAAAEELAATADRIAQQASREQARLVQQVAAIRTQLQSLEDRLEAERASEDELLALLQTRLQIRRIIGSREITAANPGIYDAMERYFGELAAEQRRAGEADTVQRLSSALDQLLQRQELAR